MHTFARIAIFVVLAGPVAAALAAGCGSNTASTMGSGGAAGSMSAGSNSTGTSTSDAGCMNVGAVCATQGDCCSGTCVMGVCNLAACTSDNQACTSNAGCCSGQCANGTCTPLNTTCKTLNNTCASGAECCSGLCAGGLCNASSFCIQTGDVCANGLDCCGGICDKANGATLGTCGVPPSGSANCGLVDGTLCGGTVQDGGTVSTDGGIPACGGACCSRLCAPYGPTGALICQPASGCHVVGDLCTVDGDCCGSAGLPGGSNKPVTCDIAPGYSVGVCRNPMGCKPDGDICRLATMSCNASCDCCSGNCQNQDTCHLDSVGVPRCSPGTCAKEGEACASSASCCNGLPCVPNPSGTPPYVCGMTSCVAKCGACTIDADCCPGSLCEKTPGSAKGVCGPCSPPPPDGGSTTSSGGGTDAGPTCSFYGQQCQSDGDCCNMVPCNGPNTACQPGQTGCTCRYLIN